MTTVATICLLVVFGLAFLAVEMFIVPGFSVPGIAGILLIGYAAFKAFAEYGLAGAFVLLSLSAVMAFILFRWALKTRAMRSFSLDETQRGSAAVDNHHNLLGAVGRSITDLRPAGTAEFDGVRYDVVTDGEYIDEEHDIVVQAVEGSRIIVSIHERT